MSFTTVELVSRRSRSRSPRGGRQSQSPQTYFDDKPEQNASIDWNLDATDSSRSTSELCLVLTDACAATEGAVADAAAKLQVPRSWEEPEREEQQGDEREPFFFVTHLLERIHTPALLRTFYAVWGETSWWTQSAPYRAALPNSMVFCIYKFLPYSSWVTTMQACRVFNDFRAISNAWGRKYNRSAARNEDFDRDAGVMPWVCPCSECWDEHYCTVDDRSSHQGWHPLKTYWLNQEIVYEKNKAANEARRRLFIGLLGELDDACSNDESQPRTQPQVLPGMLPRPPLPGDVPLPASVPRIGRWPTIDWARWAVDLDPTTATPSSQQVTIRFDLTNLNR